MVSAKCLNPNFINLDFWRRIPAKFKGIRLYEDKKSKIKEVIFSFQYIISLFILISLKNIFQLFFFFNLNSLRKSNRLLLNQNGRSSSSSSSSRRSSSSSSSRTTRRRTQPNHSMRNKMEEKKGERPKGNKWTRE